MKIILLYIILVGILFVSLLKILSIGDKLKAPLNVSGNWIIINDFGKEVKKTCAQISFKNQPPEMFIDQSGKYLKATINDSAKTQLKGMIDQDTITLNKIFPLRRDSCGSTASIKLILKVVRYEDKNDKLLGIWSDPQC